MARFNWLQLRYEDWASARAWPQQLDELIADVRMILAAARAEARPGEPAAPSTAVDGAEAVASNEPAAAASGGGPEAIDPVADRMDWPFLAGSTSTRPGGEADGAALGLAVALLDGPAVRAGRSGGVSLPSLGTGAGQYLLLLNPDLTPGLTIDMANREILTGGAQDPALGSGADDALVLAGPLFDGATVPAAQLGLETVILRPGSSYDLGSGDEIVPGGSFTVNGMPLGAGDSLRFDGSGESDGRFDLFGGAGADVLIGGDGDDRILGMGGGDTLTGGPGADVFAYENAGQSTGAGYDTLADFDPTEDRIDLPGEVSGFADAVEGGALSAASFDADLAAALGDGLGAGEALLFAPDSGDLAGTLFLVVDGNGEDGYQAGEDFVFALPNTDPADLSASTDFFV